MTFSRTTTTIFGLWLATLSWMGALTPVEGQAEEWEENLPPVMPVFDDSWEFCFTCEQHNVMYKNNSSIAVTSENKEANILVEWWDTNHEKFLSYHEHNDCSSSSEMICHSFDIADRFTNVESVSLTLQQPHHDDDGNNDDDEDANKMIIMIERATFMKDGFVTEFFGGGGAAEKRSGNIMDHLCLSTTGTTDPINEDDSGIGCHEGFDFAIDGNVWVLGDEP